MPDEGSVRRMDTLRPFVLPGSGPRPMIHRQVTADSSGVNVSGGLDPVIGLKIPSHRKTRDIWFGNLDDQIGTWTPFLHK